MTHFSLTLLARYAREYLPTVVKNRTHWNDEDIFQNPYSVSQLIDSNTKKIADRGIKIPSRDRYYYCIE